MGVDDRWLLFGMILPPAEPVARYPRLLCELAKQGVEILRFAEAVPGMVVTTIIGVIAAMLISPHVDRNRTEKSIFGIPSQTGRWLAGNGCISEFRLLVPRRG